MTKMVQVVEMFTEGGKTTTGTPQLESVASLVTGEASLGSIATADQVANIPAQSPDFADLAAVTAAYNALLAAMKTAGVMVAD